MELKLAIGSCSRCGLSLEEPVCAHADGKPLCRQCAEAVDPSIHEQLNTANAVVLNSWAM